VFVLGGAEHFPKKREASEPARAKHGAMLRLSPLFTSNPKPIKRALLLSVTAVNLFAASAQAESSAEILTREGYQYGRFEARIQFAQGDGVVSSFFLWKDRSEQSGVFWNELDFEKVGAECELATNAFYGDPERVHPIDYESEQDFCGQFHTYTYEWTPDYIAWFVDGVEIRRETGETAAAYANNTAEGMQIRFNVWPGDASFGGNFDPAILPVHQYINWVQYSSYVNGTFQFEWREDFSGDALPSGWQTASWGSPKNLSTHTSLNVSVLNGHAVLSLTADDARGAAGAMPLDPDDANNPPPVASAAPTATVDPAASAMGAPAATGAPIATMSQGPTDDGQGCSVQGVASKQSGNWAWTLLGLGLALVRRRRI
jgi:MYXO-CTERM domain-containing protein